MSNEAFDAAAAEDRKHFIPCGHCGVMIDCRDLDEVVQHWDPEAHDRSFPDMQYSSSKRISP